MGKGHQHNQHPGQEIYKKNARQNKFLNISPDLIQCWCVPIQIVILGFAPFSARAHRFKVQSWGGGKWQSRVWMSQSSPLQVELAARLFCYAILVLNLLQPVVPGRVQGAGLATAMRRRSVGFLVIWECIEKRWLPCWKRKQQKAGSVLWTNTQNPHLYVYIHCFPQKKSRCMVADHKVHLKIWLLRKL